MKEKAYIPKLVIPKHWLKRLQKRAQSRGHTLSSFVRYLIQKELEAPDVQNNDRTSDHS